MFPRNRAQKFCHAYSNQMWKVLITVLVALMCACAFAAGPKRRVYRRLLSPAEIDALLEGAEFSPSVTVGKDQDTVTQNRVSETAWVDKPEIVRQLLRRIGVPGRRYCEKLQVVRYKQGGYFRPHYDSIKDPESTYADSFKNHGHRRYTLLISLSEPEAYGGGETVFVKPKKAYKLRKGDGLLFRNVDHKGNLMNMHGGSPVSSGQKMICNLWVH